MTESVLSALPAIVALVAALHASGDGVPDRLKEIGGAETKSARRIAVASELLAVELSDGDAAVLAKLFADRDHDDFERLLEQSLRPDASERVGTNAARLAALAPDARLARPLLDRLEAAQRAGTSPSPTLLAALRSALDAAERRIAQLEAERLAQATADGCLAQFDHAAAEVRRAALARLLELAQRRGEARDEALERARPQVLARLDDPATAASADVLELVARLAAELAPADPELRQRLLARFAASDATTAMALVPALRRIAKDQPDAEVAAAIVAKVLDADAAPPRVEAALEALRFVGGDPTLDAVAPWLQAEGNGRARLREKAVAAVAEIGRRSGDPSAARRVVDLLARSLGDEAPAVRFGAALGLALVVDAIAARPREASPSAGLDAENLGRAFDALRAALPKVGNDRGLAEQCCKGLCHVSGREEAAARVLADTVLQAKPPPPVHEVLLRGLKELGRLEGLPAIAASLPKGGPSVEPDAIGKEAYAALLAVQKRAQNDKRAVEGGVATVDACLGAGAVEWAGQFARQLLDEAARAGGEAIAAEVRLAFARAAAAGHDRELLDRAWTELATLVADVATNGDVDRTSRLLLLDVAERSHDHALEAARAVEPLFVRGAIAADRRADVARRVATLLFAGGRWNECHAWLDREFVEADAPLELLVMKARAAARQGEPKATADALRLYELLLGARASGGRLACDDAEWASSVLGLVNVYCDAGRVDDARAALAALPSDEKLASDVVEERKKVAKRLAN